MTTRDIFILLAWRGERDRERIKNMTREWAVEIILHPRDKDDLPRFLSAASPSVGPARASPIEAHAAQIRQALWLRGWPDHRIEERVQEALREQDSLSATALSGLR